MCEKMENFEKGPNRSGTVSTAPNSSESPIRQASVLAQGTLDCLKGTMTV